VTPQQGSKVILTPPPFNETNDIHHFGYEDTTSNIHEYYNEYSHGLNTQASLAYHQNH